MRPRLEGLGELGPGEWYSEADDTAGLEPHRWRTPAFSRVQRVADWTRQRDRSSSFAVVMEHAGALIGVCWRDDDRELEATWPTEPTAEGIAAFSEAVQVELAGEGYTAAQVIRLGTLLADHIRGRDADIAEAEHTADFSGPRPAASTT